MKHKVWERTRKIVASLCLSAGVLAIANIETIWREYHSQDHPETGDFLTANLRSKKRAKLPLEGARPENFKPLQSALSQSLEQDELKDENPFAHLSSLDPLQQIMQKGVAKFHRETFRSPDYQDESGYDLVSYEIEHTDGSKSFVLAYLEKPELSAWRNIGAPDPRLTFVMFMVAGADGNSSYSFFKSGDLIEQSKLTNAEAETLVGSRISEGVPFLSVSR